MLIYKYVYNILLKSYSNTFDESGGILGGQNGIIKYFEFDEGIGSKSIGKYYPNVNKLNCQIDLWQENNIAFYGIIHSHFQSDPSLSDGDKVYIRQIMINMPKEIKYLYFPLVFPIEHKIVSFKAIRNNEDIAIVKDKIKII